MDAGCSSGKRKSESREWFRTFQHLSEVEFKREFKIYKSTFNFICDEMRNYWNQESLYYSVEERLAIIIWKLAHGKSGPEVARKFGIDAVTKIARSFNAGCAIIVKHLKSEYLAFPGTQTDRNTIKQGFQDQSNISNILGTIYTTHLKLKKKLVGEKPRFLNNRMMERDESRREVYSMPVQGVVDSRGIFLDIFCGATISGEKTDQEVFMESHLYQNPSSVLVQGERLIGGHSLPLKEWLLVPYQGGTEYRPQRFYNNTISDIHDIGRKAFGHLIGRWSYLDDEIDSDPEFMPENLRASVILHNICVKLGDGAEAFFRQMINDVLLPRGDEPTPSVVGARDTLAHKIYSGNIGD